MFGALGLFYQAEASGKGIVQQLADTFTFPDAVAVVSGNGVLNDYFPTGL